MMDKIEALAEAWASIDGKLEEFRACKTNQPLEDKMGHYGGYMAEAEEMESRLLKRGYSIVPTAEPPSPATAPQLAEP